MRRKSVADESARERSERIAALTPDERVALALSLGRRALESYEINGGLTAGDARRDVERRRQRRRRPSAVMDAVIA